MEMFCDKKRTQEIRNINYRLCFGLGKKNIRGQSSPREGVIHFGAVQQGRIHYGAIVGEVRNQGEV